VEKDAECWKWTGSHARGYGYLWTAGRKRVYAHRISYTLAHGEIPEGAMVDHICHNRGCVNPDHLRLASNKQNLENLGGLYASNTSGFRGVTRRRNGTWQAEVTHNGSKRYLGVFATAEDAATAAASARMDLFTHNVADRGAEK
jgi:hypothetical protein